VPTPAHSSFVEGTDGSGKSTQLYLPKALAEIGGYRLHFTEWNSSPLVKSPLAVASKSVSSLPPRFLSYTPRTSPTAAKRQIMEPKRDQSLVRLRIDGVLHTRFTRSPATVHPPIISRVKMILAIDISEKRKPQDGRIKIDLARARSGNSRVDAAHRVWRKKVVMRIFDPETRCPTSPCSASIRRRKNSSSSGSPSRTV